MDEELKAYLDRRFDALGQRFEKNERRLDEHDRRFDEHDRRFDAIDQRFEDVDRRFDDADRQMSEMREQIHQTQIMVEKLDGDIRQVAEGVATLGETMERHRAESRQDMAELRGLIETSHRSLDRRTSRLETRVDTLEAATA